jgi:5'-nucleotidase
MRLLLTNDDGINAPGLAALYEGVKDLGEVTVVAPDVERSAVGHAITLSDPLRVSEHHSPEGMRGFAVTGTPADCVKIAVASILDSPPDVVLSGINQGANVGTNVLYSGTVSAATEAAMLGIPAAALSLADRHFSDFRAAASFARAAAIKIGERGLPPGTSLNVNVPPLAPGDIRGVVITRQGALRVREWFDQRVDPRDHLYYWMAGVETVDESAEGSSFDDAVLRKGCISVTPLHYDLTHGTMLAELEEWDLDIDRP